MPRKPRESKDLYHNLKHLFQKIGKIKSNGKFSQYIPLTKVKTKIKYEI